MNGHALYAMSTVIWAQSKSLPMTAYMLNTANGAPGFGRWRITLANDDSISIILDATKPLGIKLKEDTSLDSMPQRVSKAEEPQPNPDAVPSHQVIKVDSVESDEQGHKNGDTHTHVHNISLLNQRVCVEHIYLRLPLLFQASKLGGRLLVSTESRSSPRPC